MTKAKPLPKKIRCIVNQHMIDVASPKNCQTCLGALALTAAIPGVSYMHVEAGRASWRREGYTHREETVLPRRMTDALLLLDHDRRDAIKPFAFWIKPMHASKIQKKTEAQKQAINERRRARKAEGHVEKRYHKTTRISGHAVGKLAAELGIKPEPMRAMMPKLIRRAAADLTQLEKWEATQQG